MNSEFVLDEGPFLPMIMEKFFCDIQVAGIILVSSSVVKIIIKLITLKGMLANADQFGGKGDNIRSTLNFIAKRTRVVRGKDIPSSPSLTVSCGIVLLGNGAAIEKQLVYL